MYVAGQNKVGQKDGLGIGYGTRKYGGDQVCRVQSICRKLKKRRVLWEDTFKM